MQAHDGAGQPSGAVWHACARRLSSLCSLASCSKLSGSRDERYDHTMRYCEVYSQLPF